MMYDACMMVMVLKREFLLFSSMKQLFYQGSLMKVKQNIYMKYNKSNSTT